MPELSPQAQAVWDAYELVNCDEFAIDPRQAGLAAGVRALVHQVLPENAEPVGDEYDAARADQWLRIRLKMLAIAAELEAQ